MQNFVSAPHRGETPSASSGAPNAALLIDFDNVTMGIRSDLTRQLKELLNSDIIRGKVAVQRAYADWRRYAQYIVPLSEASVDLIFAPAYGSSKKNATDIRLAIDALELVFTRPEIGTFILLSGDSDFSSLVLKLKEYGKYVIGVGLRESASDLLVQNCDEYYSYSSLTGLTKAGEEDTISAIDPWDLVERAVSRMAEENDVMRSDRLKQVMLDLDPSFDEGEIGYSKFNKFLTEAASRNKLALRKLGNGQYEVQPFMKGGEAPRAERKPRREEPRSRQRREPPREIQEERGSRRDRKPKPAPQPQERRVEDLDHGYELLKRAIRDLIDQGGDAARDSDIKRKMLELETGWDESELGFTKFSRFLRQAHDAEVIDLQRTGEGYYEARLPGSAPQRESRPRSDRGRPESREQREKKPERRDDRGRQKESAPATQATPAAEERAAPEAPEREPSPEPETKAPPEPEAKAPSDPEAKAPSDPEPEEAPAEAEEAPKAEAAPEPTPRAPTYGRRDRRGRKSDGPPPLLPGQAVGTSAEPSESETTSTIREQPADEASPDTTEAAAEADEAQPEDEAVERPEPMGEGAAPTADAEAEEPETEDAPVEVAFDPDDLGLPTEEGAVIRYLSNSYQGVGQKTAEALIETFGADRVFNGLDSSPEKVREVLGSGRRTEILLEAWQRDYRRRATAGAGETQPAG